MKSRPILTPSETKDAIPMTRSYLDGHLFRPAALTLRDGTQVMVRAITPEDEPQ